MTIPNLNAYAEQMPETLARFPNTAGPAEVHALRPAAVSQGKYQGHILIGEGVMIKSEMLKCRVIEIHGTVEGDLEAEVLIVHEKGLLMGNAKMDSAEVHGSIDGDVVVKHLLDVKAKGTVIGRTEYGELSVETGGCLVGVLNDQSAEKEKPAGLTLHRPNTESLPAGSKTPAKPKNENWYV